MKSHLFPWVYDLLVAPAERGRLGEMRHSLVADVRGRVLEIGAGTGLDFLHYPPDTQVVATDPDTGMLERARTRAEEADAKVLLVAADAEALPFREDAFDGAVVGLAMCTIPHPERALAELRRTLMSGAPLRLLEHVRVDRPVVGRLQDWLTPFWRPLAGGCHLNRRTAETVAQSGFEIESVDAHMGGTLVGIAARAPI